MSNESYLNSIDPFIQTIPFISPESLQYMRSQLEDRFNILQQQREQSENNQQSHIVEIQEDRILNQHDQNHNSQEQEIEPLRITNENDLLNINETNQYEEIPMPQSGNNAHTNQDSNVFRRFTEWTEMHASYLCLGVLKIIYDNFGRIAIIFGLFFIFIQVNRVIKREIMNQSRRSIFALAGVAFNVIGSIIFLNYIYTYNIMEFYLSGFSVPITLSIIDTLWLIIVSDFVFKLITILCKMVIVLFPEKKLSYSSRGNYFLFLEAISQQCRTIIPIRPWLTYLFFAYNGSEKIVGIIFCLFFIIFKYNNIVYKYRFLRQAFTGLTHSVILGTIPTPEELNASESECPICQDTYKIPVKLKCRHIFCNSCVTIWLDREQTCPLCRAIIVDDPSYRDGSTSFSIQMF